MKSIKHFTEEVVRVYPRIHILVNNAGVAYPKGKLYKTLDGFEMHFGVNHLGHFYLTNLLLDTLKTSSARVVILSSSLHEKGKIDFDNLNAVCVKPNENLYANSKLANVYFCQQLSERVVGSGVNVYAVCPGWVYTNLFRHSLSWYHFILVAPVAFFFMRSPKQGAQTPIYCATDPQLDQETGLLYRDCKLYNSKVKFDEDVGKKLWEVSENMIKKKLIQ